MSARHLIDACKQANLLLSIENGQLFVEFDGEPSASLLADLRAHKHEIIGLLTPASSPDVKNWRAFYEERAAHRQFDGRYSRAQAEALAWAELENRWHMQHGERVDRQHCAGCRGRFTDDDPVLDLIDRNRVHHDDDHACLIWYGTHWRAAATRALTTLGLRPPASIEAEPTELAELGTKPTPSMPP